MSKKCTLIYNPESGLAKKQKDFRVLFQEIFEANGYEVSIRNTEQKGDATKIIEEMEKMDLVVVAGGDGTLNEAVTGNIRRKEPLLLSYLPLGTTNDVGAMYGFTKDMRSNIERIINGTIQEIDICLINQQPFIYVACLGNYVNVSYQTPRELKKKYGKTAYILYGITQLHEKIHQYQLTYKVGEEEHSGNYSFLFITNTSHLAGLGLENIYKDVKLNDHMFEVALCDLKTKKEILSALYGLRTVDLSKIPGVTYYQTDHIDIHFEEVPHSSWCVDGEEYKSTEKDYHLEVKQGFKMLIPKDNVEKLFNQEL